MPRVACFCFAQIGVVGVGAGQGECAAFYDGADHDARSDYGRGAVRGVSGETQRPKSGDAIHEPVQVGGGLGGDDMSNELDRIAAEEAKVINHTFESFDVGAGTGTHLARIAPHSHISYLIDRFPDVKIAQITAMLPELEANLSALRGANVAIAFSHTPRLHLQVPIQDRATLEWSHSLLTDLEPHKMIIGKSVDVIEGTKVETVSFGDDSPHYLVCGITGAGKSVEMQQMLASLTYATSPDDLRVVIIDPKGDDFVEQFSSLPHVEGVANTKENIAAAIQYVYEQKELRLVMDREQKRRQPRIMLVIDEILEVGGAGPKVLSQLMEISGIGRSIKINILAGALRPTREGGVGTFFKDMFPVRLVGKVAAGSSYAATNIKQLYADKLPGNGSFIKTGGGELLRIQSFNMINDQLVEIIEASTKKWGQRQPRLETELAVVNQPEMQPIEQPETPWVDAEFDDNFDSEIATDRAVFQPTAADDSEEIPHQLLKVFEKYVNDDGTTRRGYSTNAAIAMGLHTGLSPTGNNFKPLSEAANTHLLTYLLSKSKDSGAKVTKMHQNRA